MENVFSWLRTQRSQGGGRKGRPGKAPPLLDSLAPLLQVSCPLKDEDQAGLRQPNPGSNSPQPQGSEGLLGYWSTHRHPGCKGRDPGHCHTTENISERIRFQVWKTLLFPLHSQTTWLLWLLCAKGKARFQVQPLPWPHLEGLGFPLPVVRAWREAEFLPQGHWPGCSQCPPSPSLHHPCSLDFCSWVFK